MIVMNCIYSLFQASLLLLLFSVGFLRSDWEIIKHERGEYVSLRSFCKFYKFNYPENSLDQEEITLKSPSFQLKIRKGSRNCFLNGARIWSTYNIVQTDSDWLISRKDVSKFFEPLLRPVNLEINSETKGVVIDPGHGGDDRGAVSRKGIREKEMTLDTAFRLEKILKSRGIATVMTRRKDVFIELEERANIAARYPDYIFVSLHFNDASGSARGIETYCFPPLGASSTEYEGRIFKRDSVTMPGNKSDLLNIFLATSIHKEIIQLNPKDEEADRGVKRARFVVLKENSIPAVLVEGGFLSNRTESSRISSSDYRQSLAEKIANGIEYYYNRGSTPTKPAVVPPTALPVTPAKPPLVPVKVPPLTNSVPVKAVTNSVSKLPPAKSTNAVVNAVTNRVIELPPIRRATLNTNSVQSPLSLYHSMTNSSSQPNLYDQPFVFNPEPAAIPSTNEGIEIPKVKPALEKSEEEVPPKIESPLKPRSEAKEDFESSQSTPEVEIYMQSPSSVRIPEVNIRPMEVEKNRAPASSEVKP